MNGLLSKKELEKAINDYAKGLTKGETFPTGWVIVASLAPTDSAGTSDSYVTITSEGLPMHSQIGLMQVAQNDVRNGMMISLVGGMMAQMVDDEDEDDD